jgi:phage gpG-like protein
MPNVIGGMSQSGLGGGIEIHIKTDFSGIHAGFKTLQRKMGKMRTPLKQASEYMTRDVITQRFRRQGIPRWKKHAAATLTRHGLHPILQLSGRLRESATGGAGFFRRYEFGSSLDYAVAHDQERGFLFDTGRSRIPGRPWSNVTQENANNMRNILLNWTQVKILESGFARK